jgi:hypothetical protein
MQLAQAHRVGHGHQHDLAAEAAGGVQRVQALAQVVGDQHAGHSSACSEAWM